jgi:hypothetical protein
MFSMNIDVVVNKELIQQKTQLGIFEEVVKGMGSYLDHLR